jgi:hypothetical protein
MRMSIFFNKYLVMAHYALVLIVISLCPGRSVDVGNGKTGREVER